MENPENNQHIEEEARKILNRIQFADPRKDFDLVMEQLINYSDLLTKNYRESFLDKLKGSLHGKKLEDKATKFFNVPSIQEILNKLDERKELYEKVCTNVREIYKKQNNGNGEKSAEIGEYNIEILDEVITPPDQQEIDIYGGEEKTFEEKEIQPRMERVLFLLKNYGIESKDIKIRIGKVEPTMMRTLSYVSIFVESLKKTIYVCNEEENITFIVKTKDEGERAVLDQMTKDERKEYISQNEGSGIYFNYNEDWYLIMERYLFSEEIDRRERHTLEYFESLDDEVKQQILRDILLTEGVLKIENRKLTWQNTINPQRKYGGYISPLNTLLGRAFGVSGQKNYLSFESIVPKIRELFSGKYETEEDPEKILEFTDITVIQTEFDEGDLEKKKEMLRTLFLTEGIVAIDPVSKILTWEKIISPNRKHGGYSSHLNTLIGNAFEEAGSDKYKSFVSIVPKIRDLFAGQYETEEDPEKILEFTDKTEIQAEFDEGDLEKKKEMLRTLFLTQEVLVIDPVSKILSWQKSINPQIKYGEYSSPLKTLLGNAFEEAGSEKYTSFKLIVPKIKELFAGQYETEEDPGKILEFTEKTEIQAEFDEGDLEKKKEMVRTLFLTERVLKIENGKLIWQKKINTNKKYRGYSSILKTLLGNAFEVNGTKDYKSFESIVPKIRELFAGQYETEEDPEKILEVKEKIQKTKLQTEFEEGDPEKKKEMLRTLLLTEEVLAIDPVSKILTWENTISPNRKYGEYSSPLKTLLGNAFGVNGAKDYFSFESIVPKIRELFKGQYEKEEDPRNLLEVKEKIQKTEIQIEFEEGDPEKKKEMLRTLLLTEEVLAIDPVSKILTWKKTINHHRKYGGYSSPLKTLIVNAFGVNGAKDYLSFKSIVPKIKELFAGQYETEEDPGKILEFTEKTEIQKEFDEGDLEKKKEMIRTLLLTEGMLAIDPVSKILSWKERISPSKKYGEYSSPLKTLLGNAFGVNGAKDYLSFESIVPKIRELFAGQYKTEEDPEKTLEFTDITEIQMEFDKGGLEKKKEMLRTLFLTKGVLAIDPESRKLTWKERISPQKKYGGYSSPLNTLLGKAFEESGSEKYFSFGSIVSKVRELFAGQYEGEEDPNGILEKF